MTWVALRMLVGNPGKYVGIIPKPSGSDADKASTERGNARVRTLHYAWFAFFLTFVIWFGHAPLMLTAIGADAHELLAAAPDEGVPAIDHAW